MLVEKLDTLVQLFVEKLTTLVFDHGSAFYDTGPCFSRDQDRLRAPRNHPTQRRCPRNVFGQNLKIQFFNDFLDIKMWGIRNIVQNTAKCKPTPSDCALEVFGLKRSLTCVRFSTTTKNVENVFPVSVLVWWVLRGSRNGHLELKSEPLPKGFFFRHYTAKIPWFYYDVRWLRS